MINEVRKTCSFVGCKKLCRNKGIYRGTTRYDKWCEYHHRLRYAENGSDIYKTMADKFRIDNSICSVCGWNKAPCDRHRINPDAGYYEENVIVLCPNCHRLEGLGLLDKKKVGDKGGR